MAPSTSTTVRPAFDVLDGRFYSGESGDPRDAYAWMRQNEPVYHDAANDVYAAASYAAVIEAERTPDVFSNAGGIRPKISAFPYMIDMDDPDHIVRRKLVNSGFTRKRVEAKIPSLSRLSTSLIDAVCEKGECDFVRDIAAPLPMAVIGEMLGVRPRDYDTLLRWSDDLVKGLDGDVSEEGLGRMTTAFAEYREFCVGTIADRRANATDDLISVLVHAEVEGARLTEDNLVLETLLILIGGDETTRHVISGGMEQLLRRPDQRSRLAADPSMLPGALEEMLRWVSPVKNMNRTVTTDVDFHGTSLSAGDEVLLMFEAANFDEEVFTDPNEFDIARTPNNHVAFGFGSHFCLGNQLARLEGRLMFERLLERLPDLALVSDDPLPRRPANFVSGLESMLVRFTPTARVHERDEK